MKIKDLSLEERPRERLIKHGPKTLSNAELLALILRQGSKKENVLNLANRILKDDLRKLSRKKLVELKNLTGIGTVKACQIIACFELGRRLASFRKEKRIQINSAKDVVKLVLPEMSTLQQEHCKGIYLDNKMRIIKEKTIFIGSLNASILHPREIFQLAITEGAAACILVHNHPSGDPQPSEEDIEVTKQLQAAGNLLGIELLDHIIIGNRKYYSLKEQGCL